MPTPECFLRAHSCGSYFKNHSCFVLTSGPRTTIITLQPSTDLSNRLLHTRAAPSPSQSHNHEPQNYHMPHMDHGHNQQLMALCSGARKIGSNKISGVQPLGRRPEDHNCLAENIEIFQHCWSTDRKLIEEPNAGVMRVKQEKCGIKAERPSVIVPREECDRRSTEWKSLCGGWRRLTQERRRLFGQRLQGLVDRVKFNLRRTNGSERFRSHHCNGM